MKDAERGVPIMNVHKNVRAFFYGCFAMVLVIVFVPLLILASGAINMSARENASSFEHMLASWALNRSMARRAPHTDNPDLDNPKAIAIGMDHYRENCVICHGAPGVKVGELAEGLNPPAPKIYSMDIQSMSDGELFWIVKNGIRMTGMPGFGKTHSDDEIQKIVALVRHLPHLTTSETELLKADTARDAEHHNYGEEKPDQASPMH
jgi:mono/diheme cytochrome c family protein